MEFTTRIVKGDYVYSSGRILTKEFLTFKNKGDMFDYYDMLKLTGQHCEGMDLTKLEIRLERRVEFDRKDFEDIGEEE